jgi:hypothetical protein
MNLGWSGALLAAALAGGAAQAGAQPAVVGWLERVEVGQTGVVLSAKLDTGADNSSLHAPELTWTRRPDGDWVAFDLPGRDGQPLRVEHKVVRVARIRQAAGVQLRPTILLGLCVGGTYRVTEVNLANRGGLSVPMLVGRSFLAGYFTVDAARQYTVEPVCAPTAADPARRR